MVYCPKHPLQELICPICEGSKGGKKTAGSHPGKAKSWGKLGGRPKKKGKGKKAQVRK